MKTCVAISLQLSILALCVASCSSDAAKTMTPPIQEVDAAPLEPARLLINVPTQNFGTVSVGTMTAPFSFVVTNAGGLSTGLVNASLSGTSAGDYKVEMDGCTKALTGAESCTIKVSFKPTNGGRKMASLNITSPFGGGVAASLDGTGVIPGTLQISPTFRDFGIVLVGQESAEVSFTITNAGEIATTNVTAELVSTGSPQFVITLNSCTGILAAAATCNVNLKFRPTSEGPATGTLQVNGGGGKSTASLAGTATPLQLASLSITPTFKNFGTLVVGQEGQELAFTVQNTGAAPSGPVVTTFAGAEKSSFVMTDNTCGAALAAAATCTVKARFRPVAAGSVVASLDVSATPGGKVSATLTGTALNMPMAATLVLDSNSKELGSVGVGEKGQVFFDLKNLGEETSGMPSLLIFGTDASEFMITDNTCLQGLLARGQCTFVVLFSPKTAGEKNVQIRVSGNPGGSATAAVHGRALGEAELNVARAFYDFGPVMLNQPRDADFVLTNIGGKPSGAISATLVGGGPTDFSVFPAVTDCRGQALRPGAVCNVRVRFLPTSVGAETTTLTIAGTPGGSLPVMLNGTGTAQSQNATGISYKYYEKATQNQAWTAIPNFATLTPIKTGFLDTFNLSARNRDTNYAFEFSGFVQITTAGNYVFYTNSDDGSRLSIDGQLIVNIDGVHAATDGTSDQINLAVGLHSISVAYFQGTSTASLRVDYRLLGAAGFGRREIPSNVLFRTNDQAGSSTSGLVGWWRMDETVGSSAADSSGNANHGILREFPATPAWTTGRLTGALGFDGTNTWVRVPSSVTTDQIASNNAFTLSAWVNLAAVQIGTATIVSRQIPGGTDEFFGLTLLAGKPTAQITTNQVGTHSCSAATALAIAPQWNHLGSTFSGGVLRLYVNGIQVCTVARTGSLQPAATPIIIGGNANDANDDAQDIFSGLIDEVAIYSRALTDVEMSGIASGGVVPVN